MLKPVTNSKNLDLLNSVTSGKIDLNQNISGSIDSELMLARHLLSSLQGVAIIAINAKGNVSYANAYAREIFNLNSDEVTTGISLLPNAVNKRISSELQLASTEFVLHYASGSALRALKVFTSCESVTHVENTIYVLHMHDITDRINTELQLRDTEKLLRNLIDASPDFISVKDAQNRWIEANCSSLELLQLNTHDYKNKTNLELAGLSDLAFKEAFNQSDLSDALAWKTGKAVRNEATITLPHGGEKVLDVIKVPLFNDDGSRQNLVTLGRDITERKIAEGHLRDRSAILDVLISCDWLLHSADSWESVADTVLQQLCLSLRFSRGSILKNSKVRSIGIAPSSKVLYKWSVPSLGAANRERKTINFDDARFNRWKEALQNGEPIFGDINSLTVAESKVLQQHDAQSIVIIPLFLDKEWWGNLMIERCDGLSKTTPQELGALMAVGRSLGVAIQRENVGKRLNQAKIAFDSATEGIMIIDDDAHIIAINKGYTDITGFSENEVLGSKPKLLQADRKDLWRILLDHEKWSGEISDHRKNGEAYQASLTITAVKNKKGKIVNYVGVFADITETKRSQDKLYALVNHDPLTGLPNRRLLNELLEHSIRRAAREKYQIGLLFIDLDRFKAINDSLGHDVGDKLLQEVSARINQSIRESDIVARLGGDEFVVMVDMINQTEDAAIIAKKIIHALQIEFIIEGKEIFIGASIGISMFPKDGADVDHLIKAADIAMYQVKSQGKNHHCFYSDDLSKSAIERFNMENQLRHALERNQLEVYYQPQVSITSGEIIGAEALIRWNHPELGLISPAKFIPVTEETGLIVQIGEWVLRQAALQATYWTKHGYEIQWVSVNVSAVQIMRSNFADTVYGMLIETDCDPSILELEITESTVMHNTEYVIDTFNRIKQLGLKLAIDDFGTGYSSLSHLKRLPLDKIKIDQSFVRGLPEDLDDVAIAKAIYAMANSLGLTVIAEGVETLAQADFLLNMGCEEAQGYLYSKAISAEEFTNLLAIQRFKGQRNAI